MAFVVKDRVRETTTTTGTGTITLAGAVSSYQAFSVIGNGNTTYYTIVGGTQWETGVGTYTASGTTLSRDTLISSSTGSFIDFAAGTKDVFVGLPATKSVQTDTAQTLSGKTFSDNPTFSGGTANAVAYLNGSKVLTTGSALTFDGSKVDVKTTINATNSAGSSMLLGKGTNFGYSTGYGVIQVGDSSGNSSTISIGYDPSVNANGAFTGDGSEVIFRNGAKFITPNAANDNWNLNTLVLKDGNVGIGTSSPAYPLDIKKNTTLILRLDTSGSAVAASTCIDYTTLGRRWVVGANILDNSNAFAFYDGTAAAERLRLDTSGNIIAKTGSFQEVKSALAANDINLSTGNYFSKTISGATSLTVSNVPASGTAISFILELTNGGSATITWWTGMKWAGGTAPTLTASGRDSLGFYTFDGGTTWNGLVLAKDIK